jgi:thiol-disulfide isomerase/thioredoxin
MIRIVAFLSAFFTSVVLCTAQNVNVITFDELDAWTKRQDDTVRVFNFWATWCKPCIEEMPAFDSLQRVSAGRKLQVIFVSLDFKSQIDKRVRPFVAKKKFAPPVVLLDAPDPNSWIDRISSDWSGAIPATLVVRTSHNVRNFYEHDFTFDELQSILQPLMEAP